MAPFDRILVPTDFSLGSIQGLRYARAFAARFGGEIVLAHVVEPPSQPFARSSKVAAAVERLAADSQRRLRELAERELETADAERALLLRGSPSAELARAAEESGVDLIVLATHGYTGMAHLLLGSTAEKLVRASHCPVLTVRPNEPGGVPAVDLRRILLATDFSERARTAMPHARRLAEASKAELLVAHVTEAPVLPTIEVDDLEAGPLAEEMAALGSARLQEIMQSDLPEGVAARAVLSTGRPHVRLVEIAREESVDLIVIASHGYTGMAHLLLGSVAERLVRHAPCPVLTVRGRVAAT